MNEQMGEGGSGFTAQQQALDSLSCWKQLFGVEQPQQQQQQQVPTPQPP